MSTKFAGTEVRQTVMNEKHIQQVLEIEKQAQEIQDKAKQEAQELPAKAQQEAQALIAKAKVEAQEEARRMIESAQSGDSSTEDAEKEASGESEFEASAKKNFDKAVAFVLERVIGKAA